MDLRGLDDETYRIFCRRQNLEKSMNTLWGLIEGVDADRVLVAEEIEALRRWANHHAIAIGWHPYSELLPQLQAAVADGVLDAEEKADILYALEGIRGDSGYYDLVTADLQKLQGVLAGIIADQRITEAELRALSSWMGEREHLRKTWPYEEVCSLVTSTMADGVVSQEEEASLLALFSEFLETSTKKVIDNPALLLDTGKVVGVCAVAPEIEFPEQTFCFTGASSKTRRSDLARIVGQHGGVFTNSMSQKVDYLVIGDNGNPCWAFACYGRKIEQAIAFRKAGSLVQIVHENDFWDAIADLGGDRR